MTIKEKIKEELHEIEQEDSQLYNVCYKLNTEFAEIIEDVCDHLSKIQSQMPDYDKHDKEHSKKVLDNIERLLQDEGIKNLTLLEAMMIELCCYFHDTGMAVPDWSFELLEAVESENYRFHSNSSVTTIETELRQPGKLSKSYDEVKELFFCPKDEKGLLSLLAQEVLAYERYRMGVPEQPKGMDRRTYLKVTRQEYLRSTHGKRSKTYAEHIGKMLSVLSKSDSGNIAKSVGKICCGHCTDIKEVQELSTQIRICKGKFLGKELTYNERYIAMLLRLGDVIHFSSDRASRTIYAEHTPMNPKSDSHWQVKFNDLHYRIEQLDGRTHIAYFAEFEDPQLYYFMHDYLNWVDDELQYYAAFIQDMERFDKTTAARYRLGLPTKVDRDCIEALGYTPDHKLKFRLEQQKILQLLMGMRLYSDEFMCLRELYQNALDACRCMRAQNNKNGLSGDIAIKFGLSTDDGGKYLFCRDEGTGMTKEVIMNYLLKVGNSYYKSADFRRANMGWQNSVAPVSEFGIGLLSCYMIGKRIEVITKHYSDNSKLYWVCMEGAEDYGYFRDVTPDVSEWVGRHGTIVKVYLKKEFEEEVNSYIPENPEDDIYQLKLYSHAREADNAEKTINISDEVKGRLELFEKSLYRRIQQFVHIPETDIPVYISNDSSEKVKLTTSINRYDFLRRLEQLIGAGFSIDYILHNADIYNAATVRLIRYLAQENYLGEHSELTELAQQFSYYQCKIFDSETNSEAYSIIHLPNSADFDNLTKIYQHLDRSVDNQDDAIYIDGICIKEVNYFLSERKRLAQYGIMYNFKGDVRPLLTVSRESIREIPDEVYAIKTNLCNRLVEEISRVICSHFKDHPSVKTDAALSYVKEYLSRKFDFATFYSIMRQLFFDVFSDYSECGVSIKDLFHKTDLNIPSFSLLRSQRSLMQLMQFVLCTAEQINVNGDSVFVKTQCNQSIEDKYNYTNPSEVVIYANVWEGIYSQYDVVSALWPLIPQRTYELYNARETLTANSKKDFFNKFLSNVAYMDSFRMKESSNGIGRADILSQLNMHTINSGMYQRHISGFADEPQKKYVIYAFISPRELSEKEEIELQNYEKTPEFIRGVREGWSILFYRYNDGYIVAPGIVDREEMVKRIPNDALDHSDGIEYCFTDGTVAF
ncbi:MAG: ATP-binding protein [Christensenellaceae bacterium]|nr:ATP-binding protein [Christensenellaceae bacterium]